MPSKDYLPKTDGNIVPWTENFVQVASANAAALGLGTVDITALKTKNADYAAKLNTAIAKQSESKAATEAKNMAKSAVVESVRSLARQIQARPGVPDNLKEQLGLNVPDPTPSPEHPQIPTELSGSIGTGGLANLKWNRNGNAYNITFLIETSNNPDAGWHIIGTTTKATYDAHLEAPLGKNYYRVIAQKGEIKTEPSNIIVI